MTPSDGAMPHHRNDVASWRAYQEEVAEFFRQLGLHAEVDVTLPGTRTRHDIDVVVRFQQIGLDALWIVECKQWQARVSKGHVMSLRAIVNDIGAERGLLMAETGFQSGSRDATLNTNVKLTSLAELKVSASYEISMMRIRGLQDRLDDCMARYWALDKDVRIKFGLRSDFGRGGYSGVRVCETVEALLSAAMRGKFPVTTDETVSLGDSYLAICASTPAELVEATEPIVADLESRLASAE
jgi:restriction system protein